MLTKYHTHKRNGKPQHIKERPQRSWWIKIISGSKMNHQEQQISFSHHWPYPEVCSTQLCLFTRKRENETRKTTRGLDRRKRKDDKRFGQWYIMHDESEVAGSEIIPRIIGNPSDFFHHPTSCNLAMTNHLIYQWTKDQRKQRQMYDIKTFLANQKLQMIKSKRQPKGEEIRQKQLFNKFKCLFKQENEVIYA